MHLKTLEELTDIFLEGKITSDQLNDIIQKGEYSKTKVQDVVCENVKVDEIIKIDCSMDNYIVARNTSDIQVGFIEYSFTQFLERDALNIEFREVLPSYRRRGIGTQLEDCLVKIAQQRRIPYITMQIMRRNLPARKNAQRNGFNMITTNSNQYDEWYKII